MIKTGAIHSESHLFCFIGVFMNTNFSGSTELRQVIERSKKELSVIEDKCTALSALFPNDIRHGLISFKTATDEIISNHYIFAASLSNSITNLGIHMSKLAHLVSIADGENCENAVIFCDTILSSYNSYLSDVNQYLNQTNRAIQKNKANTSLYELYTYLSELLRKTKNFEAYLSRLDF